MPLKIIADQTRSGKFITRPNHIKKPKSFNIVMHMTLTEKRLFESWFVTVCREGLYPFSYPKVDDNTGELKAYQFDPQADPSWTNVGADNLEVSMVWQEAV
jgi:hypothetical protein